MDLLKIIVSIVIFLVLAASLLQGLFKVGKEGFEEASTNEVDATDSISYTDAGSSDAKADTKADAKPDAKTDAKTDTKADTKPDAKTDATADTKADKEDEETMDIAIENTTKLTQLFDKVNNQIDIIRTLKTPYSNKVVEIKFLTEEGVSPDTIVQTNLLHILRNGVKPNDNDLQSNAGIKKYYSYGGMMPIIDKLIQSISSQCTAITDINKCYRMSNQKNISRLETIINTHQSILDKIMEKQ
jgi:predicted  nucleic acid-binding Zn-ribbon protein